MSLELVHRPQYEALLERLRGNGFVKVITGVRRCGKSSLLRLLRERLLAEGVPSSNVYLRRLDALDVPIDPTAQWLSDDVAGALRGADPHVPFYAMFDEVQEVEGWEKVVRRLCSSDDVDVYLTGSNSKVLSSDLATLLSGRYVQVNVYPLSYAEYLSFARQRGLYPSDGAFARYVRYGGMPALFSLRDYDEAEISRVLRGITDTVILNDVAARLGVRDIDLLQKLVRYVFSTSGNLFSIRSVANALAGSGRRPSVEAIDGYLEGLGQANILIRCDQVGLAGKDILRPQRKFYPVDTGLRNYQTGFATRDLGFQLENVVCVELMRRGYGVRVGGLPSGEVDFVASRGSERLYVQVVESMTDQRTYERELAPFARIADSFPKMVLTADAMRAGTTETGVAVRDVRDWLLAGD